MDKIQIRDLGPQRGRGLIATSTVAADETLFVEYPLVCCQYSWNKLYGYLACDYCLHPLESALCNAKRLTGNENLELPYWNSSSQNINPTACSECGTHFCSPDCLKNACSLYHVLLCPGTHNQSLASALERLDEVWRQTHFPPETGTIMLLARIVAISVNARFSKSENCAAVINELQSFVSAPVETSTSNHGASSVSHKLLRPEFASSVSVLHTAFVEMLFQLVLRVSPDSLDPQNILRQCNLDGLLSVDGFTSALCLLGRNGQGIATSSFSIWVRETQSLIDSKMDSIESTKFNEFLERIYDNMDEHVGTFLDNEGVGLYARQRFLNHSCSPNAVIQFTGANSCLSVVSLRDIQANEEVTISYLDECQLARSRHSRRKILASNYLFWCECPKCTEEKSTDGYESVTSEDVDDDSMDEG